MKQKVLTIAVVVLLVGIIGVSSFTVIQQTNYQNLDSQYQELLTEHETLSSDYDAVVEDYNAVIGQYQSKMSEYDQLISTYNLLLSDQESLQIIYDQLQVDFDTLQGEYNALVVDYAQLQSDYDTLQSDYDNLLLNYNTLWTAYQALQDDYDSLQTSYDALQAGYDNLESLYLALDASYNQLQTDFDALQLGYDTLTTWIRQQTLPAQYMIFAEAVRRYYFEDFYVQNKWAEGNISGHWTEFTRFCRDVILHDSQTGNFSLEGSWFPDVSNALADCLRYGNRTEYLAFQNFYWTLYPWLPNWAGFALPVDDLDAIAQVTQWCIDNIDYEYDSDITRYQEPYGWDYIKFPVETAFRTKGDCEDQAILAAAYLESCGFDTMMVTIHDPEWDNGTGLYHGVPMIWWDNDWGSRIQWGFWFGGAASEKYVYGEGWWVFLDTTWDTPFGTDPSWLSWYTLDDGMPDEVFDYQYFSYAVCDMDGWISYVPSGGAALEASMP